MVWFYLLHTLNWNFLKSDEPSEGAVNTRTFMIGAVFYILTYIVLDTVNPFYNYTLWWIFFFDCLVMSTKYRRYYKRSTILHEVPGGHEFFKEKPTESADDARRASWESAHAVLTDAILDGRLKAETNKKSE